MAIDHDDLTFRPGSIALDRRTRRRMLTGLLALCLGCGYQVIARAQDLPRSNWTTADPPCSKYDDLRSPALGDIGVKIDTTEPWANAFRRALGFWNTVVAANFHEETNLSECALRIVNGGPDILDGAMVARSQFTDRDNFRGKIVVNPLAAKGLSNAEMYGTAVHEFGHILGLSHNANCHSVMYYLNVNGTEVLDAKDVLALSIRHQLRVAVASTGFLPIKVALIP